MFSQIKTWIIAALGGAVGIVGAIALYFRGSAKDSEAKINDRDRQAAQAKVEDVVKANEAIQTTQEQNRAEEAKTIDEAINSDDNPFNTRW